MYAFLGNYRDISTIRHLQNVFRLVQLFFVIFSISFVFPSSSPLSVYNHCTRICAGFRQQLQVISILTLVSCTETSVHDNVSAMVYVYQATRQWRNTVRHQSIVAVDWYDIPIGEYGLLLYVWTGSRVSSSWSDSSRTGGWCYSCVGSRNLCSLAQCRLTWSSSTLALGVVV